MKYVIKYTGGSTPTSVSPNLIRTDADIKTAVDEWIDDPTKGTEKYGHISVWDTSRVTNMKSLFEDKDEFNEDISKWDVSSVTNMNSMFYRSFTFNQPLDSWDVSSVTNMSYMFALSYSFNQPLNSWDVSSVKEMKYMFYRTSASWGRSFNQDIGLWIINDDCNIEGMFEWSGVKRNTFLPPPRGTGRGIYGSKIANYFNPPLPNPSTNEEIKKERNLERRKYAMMALEYQYPTNVEPTGLGHLSKLPLAVKRKLVQDYIGGSDN